MLFPDTAKRIIANHFYDKEVKVFGREETIDSEGGVVREYSERGSFSGNVQFDNLGEIQSELGMSEAIDIVITCSDSVYLGLEDVIEYDSKRYDIISVIPYDSHKKVIGKKCLG